MKDALVLVDLIQDFDHGTATPCSRRTAGAYRTCTARRRPLRRQAALLGVRQDAARADPAPARRRAHLAEYLERVVGAFVESVAPP